MLTAPALYLPRFIYLFLFFLKIQWHSCFFCEGPLMLTAAARDSLDLFIYVFCVFFFVKIQFYEGPLMPTAAARD